MAFAETAPLIAALKLDDKFSGPLKNAGKALGSFDAKLDHTQSRAFRAGQQIGTGIKNTARIATVGVGILVSQVALGLNSLIKLEQAQAQTNAVLKSTGGIAGQTGADITRLSEKYEGLNATIGDEFIRAGANMLLTFTNIRSKAFEPSLAAILDVNTALGKGPEGLTGTAILVGKALNDPIKGLTALRRVGVQVSAAQEKQIRTLVEQNDLYGAQRVILGELNKEFGGSFIAQGNTTAGKIAKFTDSVEDLQRALAEALLPTLGNVADALTKTLADPSVVQGVKDFGKSLADLISPANLAEAGSILQDVFNTARAAAPGIAAAAQIMGQVVGTAVGVFRTLPKEIQQLAIGAFAINKLTGGLVTNVAGGILGGIAKGGLFSRGSSPANPLFVADVTGGGAGGAAGGLLAGGKWAAIGKVIGGAFAIVAAAEIADLIHGAITPFGGLEGRTKAGKLLPADQLSWPFGPKNTPRWIIDSPFGPINVLGGDSAFPKGEQFGPPGPGFKQNPVRPSSVDSIRTTPADMAAITAAIARGRAAGYKPTFASAQETLQRNISRAAEAALVKQDAIKSAILSTDTRSELAGIRNAVASAGQKPPTTNVKVTVNVTAAQVAKSVVVQRRFGPPGGSRESDAGHYGGAGT